MKKITAVIFLMALFAAPSFAQSDTDGDFIDEAEATEMNLRGYWHCTAYPNGHGHHFGYSYRDIHYSHARQGAMRRCEWATHMHCHHIDCHYDHH